MHANQGTRIRRAGRALAVPSDSLRRAVRNRSVGSFLAAPRKARAMSTRVGPEPQTEHQEELVAEALSERHQEELVAEERLSHQEELVAEAPSWERLSHQEELVAEAPP
jgi:hypothetical protein